jgi:peroxiredoxin 2/4
MSAKVGQKAPDFAMPTTKDMEALDKVAKLSDYQGKWLVLFFYPLDFTFVCPTEIRGFNSRLDEFRKAGAEILGVSVDSVYSHRAWVRTSQVDGGLGGLEYPLASDITKQVSRDYGVLIEDQGIALRGLFIIDPEGILRYQVVSDLNVGRRYSRARRDWAMTVSSWFRVAATVARTAAIRPIRSRVLSSGCAFCRTASADSNFCSAAVCWPETSNTEAYVVHNEGQASNTVVGSELSQFRTGATSPRKCRGIPFPSIRRSARSTSLAAAA